MFRARMIDSVMRNWKVTCAYSEFDLWAFSTYFCCRLCQLRARVGADAFVHENTHAHGSGPEHGCKLYVDSSSCTAEQLMGEHRSGMHAQRTRQLQSLRVVLSRDSQCSTCGLYVVCGRLPRA